VTSEQGFFYVSVSLDLFSRKVVGISMGFSLETPFVVKTLDQAFTHRKTYKGLMHPSDQGCQYISKYFKDFMKEHVDFFKYRTRGETINSIFEYIEVFYNKWKLHSTLGYYSPVKYDKLWDIKHCSGF
jgi:putative transposase